MGPVGDVRRASDPSEIPTRETARPPCGRPTGGMPCAAGSLRWTGVQGPRHSRGRRDRVTSTSGTGQSMAGRHARRAPVVISRALATVTLSALLLAVGVVAMTVFTGGERPANGGPQAQRPRAVATGPSAEPTVTTTGSSGSSGSTTGATSGQPAGGPSPGAGGGEVVGPVGAGGATTSPVSGPVLPVDLNGPSGTSSGSVAPVGLPLETPGVLSSARGWLQRSDSGRAHGKAVGLLARAGAGHGCRPVPTRVKPVSAQAEPRGCS
jgi:hypothetical protein